MTRGKLIIGGALLTLLAGATGARAQDPDASGRGVQVERRPGADRAVVRDQQGALRPGPDRARLRGARRRPDAADHRLQRDLAGVSVALLFDVSGSMEGQLPNAREAATHVLSWLDASRDEAAIFTFDTHLDERTPFTPGLRDAARRR